MAEPRMRVRHKGQQFATGDRKEIYPGESPLVE